MSSEGRGAYAYRGPATIGRRLAFVRGAGIAFAVTVIVALVSLIREGGYGTADLPVYLLASVFFASVVGLLAAMRSPVGPGTRPAWRLALALAVGALVGLAGTLAAALFFGPAIGAASLPIVIAWVLAGSLGLALARRRLARSTTREFGGVAAIAFLLALIVHPLILWARDSQQLELYWLVRSEGSRELVVTEGRGRLSLDRGDEEVLRAAGVVGMVDVLGWSRHGEGPRATMYVVVDRPVTRRQALKQPDAEVAVYVQEGHGFRLYPAGVDLHDHVVEVVPREGVAGFDYWIEGPGGRSMGHIALPAVHEGTGG